MHVLATCQELKLRFSAQIVLDGAALTMHEGDKLGIVGRNGCGKSSFLKILAKVDDPDDGEVAWRGNLLTGYLPQDFELNEQATVLENVRDGARHVLDLVEEFEKRRGIGESTQRPPKPHRSARRLECGRPNRYRDAGPLRSRA